MTPIKSLNLSEPQLPGLYNENNKSTSLGVCRVDEREKGVQGVSAGSGPYEAPSTYSCYCCDTHSHVCAHAEGSKQIRTRAHFPHLRQTHLSLSVELC